MRKTGEQGQRLETVGGSGHGIPLFLQMLSERRAGVGLVSDN